MTIQYNIVDTGDHKSISVVVDGEIFAADGTHPNWSEIVEAALALDYGVVDLFDRSAALSDQFEQITDRVSVNNGRVFFDGDEVDNEITRGLVRAMDEGSDFVPVARFLENLASNPSEHSKENLYRWIKGREFSISDDGCLVGYKGIMRDATHGFVSVSSGTAIVDGQKHQGQIPNYIGAVVMMPRSEVTHDPSIPCHIGLHVGTWNYASNFGSGGTLKVHVNPRDVVSVPSDTYSEKMRVCRYEVVDIIEKPVDTFVDEVDEGAEDDEAALAEWERELLGLDVQKVEAEAPKKRSFWPFGS